jgi:metal-sulfur cluster biosynthetic enzyme
MAEEMNAAENELTEETMREALRVVVDPELHLDIVTLGLLRGVDLEKDPVLIKMLLTTPFCPYGPWLIQQVKETAELTAGRPVKVEVLPEQWHPEMMEDPTLLGFF